MTKTKLARSTSRHRAPSRRHIAKPAIFDLYEQVREIVSPLELELRYAELEELVSQLVDIMWAFVGALARAHGYNAGLTPDGRHRKWSSYESTNKGKSGYDGDRGNDDRRARTCRRVAGRDGAAPAD